MVKCSLYRRLFRHLFASGLWLLSVVSMALAAGGGTYEYRLCDFNGKIPSLWARVAVDREVGEVYALDLRKSQIQIFNRTGMLVYAFGQDLNLAGAADIAAGEGGDIYVAIANLGQSGVLHLDYRGKVISFINLDKIPKAYLPFRPTRLDYRSGSLYLLDGNTLRLVVLSRNGSFQKGYALQKLIEALIPARDKAAQKATRDLEVSGFSVDGKGRVYFTVPSIFSAFRLSPTGNLESFGKAGSGRGKFGVVSGIGTDERGNIYVADRLRCVVMAFNGNFHFLREFGYRGSRPANLIVPDDVAVDGQNGRLYVAQAANQGVSVFRLGVQ